MAKDFLLLCVALGLALPCVYTDVLRRGHCSIGKKGLCARSIDKSGECFPRATFQQAKRICKSANARLCTARELLNDEAAYTGCGFNDKQIWSSSSCERGHRAMAGATPFLQKAPERCSPDSSKNFVRCCYWRARPRQAPSGDKPFKIQFRNRGGLSNKEMKMFLNGGAAWERVITGIKGSSGVTVNMDDETYKGQVDGLLIDIKVESRDGPGGVLGIGGPRKVREENLLPYYGVISLDRADIQRAGSSALKNIAVHEIAHVLGLGTTWDWWRNEGRFIRGERFIGKNAVREYAAARGGASDRKGVPLADTGSAGTRGGHWKEATFLNEIFTGYISTSESAKLPISRVTAGALEDLGYAVSYGAASRFSIPSGAPTILEPRLNDTALVAFSGPAGVQFYGVDRYMLLSVPSDILVSPTAGGD